MLDEQFVEISSYKSYVKPVYNTYIYKKYEELTGISSSMVVGARKFDDAMHDFMEWCGENYVIYAWSDSDKSQIEKEMLMKNISRDEAYEYMLVHWVDFQAEFGKIVEADKLLSLEKALNMCGISFQGQKHDALFDARNTSHLYIESRINDVTTFIKQIKDKIEENSLGATLGDMFNFTSLGLQFV